MLNLIKDGENFKVKKEALEKLNTTKKESNSAYREYCAELIAEIKKETGYKYAYVRGGGQIIKMYSHQDLVQDLRLGSSFGLPAVLVIQ